MRAQIEDIKRTRTFLLNLIAELPLEQWNYIPEGFNNNLVWNVGHLVAGQQGLCYGRAGLPLQVEQSFFETYKPGSKPEKAVTAEEIEDIKKLLFSTLDQLADDIEKGMFANYTSWTTRTGVPINNIGDAVRYVAYHEGLHTGYVMAQRRVLAQQKQSQTV